MTATFKSYRLTFRNPVLTSRGSMAHKNGYFITIEHNGIKGIGECSYIEGLSIDRMGDYEQKLMEICDDIEAVYDSWLEKKQIPVPIVSTYPSIAFGLETALLDLSNGGKHEIIKGSRFCAGRQAIPVNGLVWMGAEADMHRQIDQKIADGFRCIKIKVAAIDFTEECRLLESLRLKYTPEEVEIRLDANGGFTPADVREKLNALAQFTIHSIEQPIKPQQYILMHELCREQVIPITLDEELIGTGHRDMKIKLLETIRPQYIILKPSLLGGLKESEEWIEIADGLGTAWWVTSALEGNIGLNAIAQWTASVASPLSVAGETGIRYQGLGTGGLYTNNVASPLFMESGQLKYKPDGVWEMLDHTQQ